MIFGYLDVKDKGKAARVCLAWRDAAYHRSVWRGVTAKLHLRRANPSLFPSLVKRGITKVQVLSLRRSLKDVIQGVPNLETLNLSGCYNVTDIGLGHAFVQDLHSITVLNLSLCKQITDSSITRIARHFRNLEVLELGGCSHITSNGLLHIAMGLTKLKYLNLRSCRQVSDTGIGSLCGQGQMEAYGCHRLEHLVMQDCQKLTDQALKHISLGLTKLRSLNLSFCASVTDSGLKFLAKMPLLNELNLRSCDNVSDLGVGFLAEGGSHITNLDVSFCERVSDTSLAHISQGLFHLQSLSVCASNITDEGVEKLVRSTHELTTLNIGQCSGLTDQSLTLIAQHLKGLRSIDLYGCTKITTVGIKEIMSLKQLEVLNLGLWCKK